MISFLRVVTAALVLAGTIGTGARVSAQAPPAARPADVASIDAILHAVYDVISGPAGQKRDWDRFRSLFQPGARLIPSGPRQQGGFGLRMMTPDEYAETAGASLEERGFFEVEIARTVEEAPTNRVGTRPTKRRSLAASTASSCSTTGAAGGSCRSSGNRSRPQPRSRRSTCRARPDDERSGPHRHGFR
jgi:hypothetical protein